MRKYLSEELFPQLKCALDLHHICIFDAKLATNNANLSQIARKKYIIYKTFFLEKMTDCISTCLFVVSIVLDSYFIFLSQLMSLPNYGKLLVYFDKLFLHKFYAI